MTSPFEQEVARLNRLRQGLHSSLRVPAVDAMDQRIDDVCARVRQGASNAQAGTSLLNVRPSSREDVNADKVRLARDIDELVQNLTPPAAFVGDLLDLYLPGYGQEGYPVQPGTRQALATSGTVMHPGVLGEISVLNAWNVPSDSPVRSYLEGWLELHKALKEADTGYDILSADHAQLLTDVDSELVLDDDLGWDGTFLTQTLSVTDLSSGEVQVLNLTHVTLNGDTWVLTTDHALPPITSSAAFRLTTTDGAFSGDLPHQRLEVQGHDLHVIGVPSDRHALLADLTVTDVAQVTVLQSTPPLDTTRHLN